MTAIIDYGLGNLGSIRNMLRVIEEKSVITDEPEKIREADRIILPGVGAFDTGVQNLEEKELDSLICSEAESNKPILGICLGMQLLGRKSEEGSKQGLNLIPFDNVKFDFSKCKMQIDNNLRIPHMGWDIVDFMQNSPLTEGIVGKQRYYFVHSFHAVCDNTENILMTCEYGYRFAAAVVKKNVYGVQFHPEKSHEFGMRILENFVQRCR